MAPRLHGSKLGMAWLGVSVIIGLVSCDALGEIQRLDMGDITPPQLSARSVQDNGTITLAFDEAVRLKPGSLHLNTAGQAIQLHPQAPDNASGFSPELKLDIDGETIPGKAYSLELSVEDAKQNSLSLIMPFYGPNRRPAKLLINEILTAISSKNRDTVELCASQGGNIGGMTLFWGIPSNFDYAWSLPAMEINTGDRILVHCKPEGIADEQDELSDAMLSGGKNSSAFAYDFWLRDAPGLPDSSGILCLADNPLGAISDALFYSDKLSTEGKDYRSFGSQKFLDRAERLQALAVWKCQGELIAVEDAARSDDLTATRSLNRNAAQFDSNSASDWHTVPSGQSSLGTVNSDAQYIKP